MGRGDDFGGRQAAALVRCDTRAFLETCPAPVAEIFGYWDGLRAGRAMPRRADFRPEAVPRHLPAILLIDVEGVDDQGVGVYRYRVVGTESVRLRGRDPTGKLVRDGFFWSSAEAAIAVYESVRTSGRHLYQTAEFVSPEGRWRSEHTLLLPFSEGGTAVTQILVYSVARSSRES
ncbi:MAG TPA: PAS domain-containing protein [Kiloniellaceae bacterium]|nr:PAS domain-containing protein [Kiloniellaceae bacterium]